MKIATYYRDQQARRLEAEVLSSATDPSDPFVVLSDTVLYPEGGGQPRDHGTVDGVPVTDVRSFEGGFLHALATPLTETVVTVELDWSRRWDHMQQHTGQHLLSAIAADRFGLETTSFHLGAEVSDIELDRPDLTVETIAELEAAVATEIEAARPVTTRWAEPESLPEAVRSRGLPADHEGPVRLVEIDGIDCNTCGGTHVASTAEIGGLALLGAETMRGGSRLLFVAGSRWRQRLALDERLLGGLRLRLECGDDEMEGLLERRLAELGGLQRRLRQETEAVARVTGEQLAARPEAVLEAHFEHRDGGFLRQVASVIDARSSGRLAFLTANRGDEVFFLLSGAPDDDRIAALGPTIASLLDGRGGGRGGAFQGKGGNLARRAEALSLLTG